MPRNWIGRKTPATPQTPLPVLAGGRAAGCGVGGPVRRPDQPGITHAVPGLEDNVVRTWLIRITHNLAIDVVRTRRFAPVDPHDLQELLPVSSRTPEQDALAEEKSTQLRAALAAIPQEQARAVIMASIHAMTAREIAEIEHIPLGTAKSRIRAGLISLNSLIHTS
jgi:RNA polymerase sigma factor (sigma-70 family)